MSYYVITHAGKAHIDEILAIAALSVFKKEAPETILRLSDAELQTFLEEMTAEEEWWIIDCGFRYDPENRFFDHHQDGHLDSAALLVFDYCFPELKDSTLGDYFRLVSKVDTGGLRSLGEFDAHSEIVEYWSMLHQMLVKIFETDPLNIVELVSQGLKEKMAFEHIRKAASEWLSVPKRLVEVQVEGLTVLEYKERPPEEIVAALKSLGEDYAEEHQAAAIYGFDKNDPEVRTLYRTDSGHKLLDFTRAAFFKAIFVHQNGFLVRFKPQDDQEWRRVIAQSIIP